MADLRAALEDDGLQSVRTYIQSGNVLFESDEPQASLEDRIEAALEGRFGFPILVVVRSHRQLRAVVQKAPEGFGQQPDLYHSDAIFLKAPLTAKKTMRPVVLRQGVAQACPGTSAGYRWEERRGGKEQEQND